MDRIDSCTCEIQEWYSIISKLQILQEDLKLVQCAGWHTFFAHPTDACDEWLVGDLDNSGDLNVFDILLLSEVANNNGSGICPASVADINNDDMITVVDIVFLVNIILNP